MSALPQEKNAHFQIFCPVDEQLGRMYTEQSPPVEDELVPVCCPGGDGPGVHRLLLAAHSPLLRDIFCDEGGCILLLVGFSPRSRDQLRQLLYTGQTRLTTRDYSELVELIRLLHLKVELLSIFKSKSVIINQSPARENSGAGRTESVIKRVKLTEDSRSTSRGGQQDRGERSRTEKQEDPQKKRKTADYTGSNGNVDCENRVEYDAVSSTGSTGNTSATGNATASVNTSATGNTTASVNTSATENTTASVNTSVTGNTTAPINTPASVNATGNIGDTGSTGSYTAGSDPTAASEDTAAAADDDDDEHMADYGDPATTDSDFETKIATNCDTTAAEESESAAETDCDTVIVVDDEEYSTLGCDDRLSAGDRDPSSDHPPLTHITVIEGDLMSPQQSPATEMENNKQQEEEQELEEDQQRVEHMCDSPDCRQIFLSVRSLQKHTLTVHGVNPLACPVASCTFRGASKYKLKQHLAGVHRETHSHPVTCLTCSSTFPSTAHLQNHVSQVHTTAENLKICPHCGIRKAHLADHIIRAHKPARFTCSYCPKKFKTRVQLRMHHNMHTGFRPYTCSDCPATFSRLHHRKLHERKTNHVAGPVLKPPDHEDCRLQQQKHHHYQQHHRQQHHHHQPLSEHGGAGERLETDGGLLQVEAGEAGEDGEAGGGGEEREPDDDGFSSARERLQEIGVDCAEIIRISFETIESIADTGHLE